MKVKINSWNAIATWVWDIDTESNCTICQLPFESPCPKCKVPGDECVPSIFFFFFFMSFKKKKKKVQGMCNHHFHLHCIIRWTEEGSSDVCPLCREKWVVKR